MPERLVFKTAILIISQRVAPSPRAASLTLSLTVAKTSRVMAEIVGIIMIARTTAAVSMPTPKCGGPNNLAAMFVMPIETS